AFELARVLDGAGRTGLDAEPAVHALADVDVEPLHPELGRNLSVALEDVDVDDLNRARALAGLARGADVHVHFQETAVARRDRMVHGHRHPIRILRGDRLPEHVAERDAHAFPEALRRVADVLHVRAEGAGSLWG